MIFSAYINIVFQIALLSFGLFSNIAGDVGTSDDGRAGYNYERPNVPFPPRTSQISNQPLNIAPSKSLKNDYLPPSDPKPFQRQNFQSPSYNPPLTNGPLPQQPPRPNFISSTQQKPFAPSSNSASSAATYRPSSNGYAAASSPTPRPQSNQPLNTYLAPKTSTARNQYTSPSRTYISPQANSNYSPQTPTFRPQINQPSTSYLSPNDDQGYTSRIPAPKPQAGGPSKTYLSPQERNNFSPSRTQFDASPKPFTAPQGNNRFLAQNAQTKQQYNEPSNKYIAPETPSRPQFNAEPAKTYLSPQNEQRYSLPSTPSRPVSSGRPSQAYLTPQVQQRVSTPSYTARPQFNTEPAKTYISPQTSQEEQGYPTPSAPVRPQFDNRPSKTYLSPQTSRPLLAQSSPRYTSQTPAAPRTLYSSPPKTYLSPNENRGYSSAAPTERPQFVQPSKSYLSPQISTQKPQPANTYLTPQNNQKYLPPTQKLTPKRPAPNNQPQIGYEGDESGQYNDAFRNQFDQVEPNHVHEPGMPFDFNYSVLDDEFKTNYLHNAKSDGDVTQGEYSVLLPDGRKQIVKYVADWKKGYMADITYEGEANFPELDSNAGGYSNSRQNPENEGYKY